MKTEKEVSMSAEQETVAYIVHQMREDNGDISHAEECEYADRIEAANRREVLAAKVCCESFSDYDSKIWEQKYRSEVCVSRQLETENAELKRTIDDNLRVAKACRDSDYDEKAELREERARLLCENAKLREALKPITELDLAIHATPFMLNGEYVISGEEMLKHVRRITDAVSKAQEIVQEKEDSAQK